MAESSPDDEVKPAAGAGSAEERCPICLEDYEDKAFIDACFHAFCFGCIVKAVEMTTGRCPMCKASFDTVIHNVRAIDDYDRYKVQSKPTPPPPSSLPAMQEEAFRTFRGYRTTRLPGQPRTQEQSPASTSVDHTRHTGSAVTVHQGNSSSANGSQQQLQGLLLDPSKSSNSRKQTSTHPRRQSRKPAALERRRAVYSTRLRALPIEASDSRRIRVRDISASFFRSNPACTHRLFPWLTREFKILVGDEHVEFMLQLMQSLIDKIDLESEEFGSHLEPFLHEKTQHFMHELVSFAKSPYDMIAYDNRVRYDWPETHPQAARERTSGGNMGEITETGSQPGPSGMQQRVLEELMLSRWGSSPPPLHSGSSASGRSHSPTIVIQDSSDSETEPYPDHTPSPSASSQLPTKATREIGIELSEETAQLATNALSNSSLNTATQGDIHAQISIDVAAAPPTCSSSATSKGDKQPSDSPSDDQDLIIAQETVQAPSAQTELQEQVTLTRTSTEAVTPEECKQSRSASTRDDILSDEQLANIDSCPEVSSSSSTAAVIPDRPVPMDDQVSSTSENIIEATSQPTSSSAAADVTNLDQPHFDVLPREEATPLLVLQSRDQVQVSADDDDFEISLYAEDGGASLGEGSTPSSEILKKSRKDRDIKSSRISKLKKKSHHHHHGEGRLREKERAKSGSRHSESRRHKSERDRERHHRVSHHQRSRSRSHSRSRGHHRSHRRHSTDREYSSRSRHRSRSREREYLHKRRSHRSRSRSVSRHRHSHSSCSSDDGDTTARIKSTVIARNWDEDERVSERTSHRHERRRRERSESLSPPHRHNISSHYRGEHDYERLSSDYDSNRGHHVHSRGRLYSDDTWSDSQPQRSVKSARHSSTQESDHSSQRKRTARLDEERQKSKASSSETKLLAQELSEVDRRIQDNKKELLKSMLRKERLELLQKNLHGGESSVVDASAVLQKSTDVTEAKSVSEMEKELELLNRAITDGKKQLLRVMKRMEEEQIEINQD